ncbi:MAG: hypothetical protein GXP04_07425, partial [Alphaproteobacteria bacterium]|nr:hypothetical protein [Alphaproteobacteria bacterium]
MLSSSFAHWREYAYRAPMANLITLTRIALII